MATVDPRLPTAYRQPVPVILALANANCALRPVGARASTVVNRLANLQDAAALVDPLGLSRPLRADDLKALRALAHIVRAMTTAIVDRRVMPSLQRINKFSRGASATRVLTVGSNGKLSSTLQWTADNAVSEIASRAITELSQLDPDRLRRCARQACGLLFYDVSRPGTQRWHSESPCGIRERQDRYRAGRQPS